MGSGYVCWQMVRTLTKLMKTPHPVGFGWSYALVPALIVCFILFSLQPYGLDTLTTWLRLWKSLAYGAVTAASAPVNLWLARTVLPRWVDTDRWTFGDELVFSLYDIVIIGFWNTLMLFLIEENKQPFWELLVEMEGHTVVIGILPILSLVGIKHFQALKRQLLRAERMNEGLTKEKGSVALRLAVVFASESGKPEIQLEVQGIILMASTGNYVDIYYWDPQRGETKYLLRNRMKRLLEALPDPPFFQCHKSFVVNCDRIQHVSSNSRDFRLTMTGTAVEVPVSRSKGVELMDRLGASLQIQLEQSKA